MDAMDACPEDTSLYLGKEAEIPCNPCYEAPPTRLKTEEERDKLVTDQDVPASEVTASPPGSYGPGRPGLWSHGSNGTTLSAGEVRDPQWRSSSGGVSGSGSQVPNSNTLSLSESLQNRVAWLEGDLVLLQMRIDALHKPQEKASDSDIKQLIEEEVRQAVHAIKGQISIELVGSSVEALETLREQCMELTAASADAIESLRQQHLKQAAGEAGIQNGHVKSPDEDVARCEEAIAVLARRLAEAQARLQAESTERCAGLAQTLEDLKYRLHAENEEWKQNIERSLRQLLQDSLHEMEQDMEVHKGNSVWSSGGIPPSAAAVGRFSEGSSGGISAFPGSSPASSGPPPNQNVFTSVSMQSPSTQSRPPPPCIPPLALKVASPVSPTARGDHLSSRSQQDSPREALQAPVNAPILSSTVPMLVHPHLVRSNDAMALTPQMPTPRRTPRASSASRGASPMMEPVQTTWTAHGTAWHWPQLQSLPPFGTSLEGSGVGGRVPARCSTPRGAIARSASMTRSILSPTPTPMGPIPVCSLSRSRGRPA